MGPGKSSLESLELEEKVLNILYMLEDLLQVYKEKKVLVTGNTGFKGSWISQWLLQLNAEVSGYALDPPTEPALFTQLELE